MSKPIYLDYMSTTPVDPQVAAKMQTCLTMDGCFGNPASTTHVYGYEALEKVSLARKQVADLINADPREIVWTSGATESDNLAIIGAAQFYQRKGKHIITMSTEHKAVLDTVNYLASIGFEITRLDPQENGLLDLDRFAASIRPDTILASIMHVNNETGVIQDIQSIGKITRQQGVLLHVDAAQSAGKLLIDLQDMAVDLMSFSAHKIYGPKGIGALYVRRNPQVRLQQQIYGGGHERGMRSGTLATHQIVGMGEAFALAGAVMEKDRQHVQLLQQKLWQALQELGGVQLHGDPMQRIANCLNISIDGVAGEALLTAFTDIAISTGSACTSANPKASHVLTAMGLTENIIRRSLRISLGRFTTTADIEHVIQHMREQILRLRSMSPLWQV